jgi:transcriptional regulator with XRE-family HTH domain
MNYNYDYRFLSRFMRENNLTKKDLLEALGVTDYVSLNRWLDGLTPIHLAAMLRMCNYYQIPVSSFFMDGDSGVRNDEYNELPQFHPTMPHPDAQPLPTDGYGMDPSTNKKRRGQGIVNPNITERKMSSFNQRRAVEQGLLAAREYYNRTEGTAAHKNNETLADNQDSQDITDIPTNTDIPGNPSNPSSMASMSSLSPDNPAIPMLLRMQLDHANELRRLEKSHRDREDVIRAEYQKKLDTEHNRLLNLIEKQQEELNRIRRRTSDYGLFLAEPQPGEKEPAAADDDEMKNEE